MSSHSVIDTVVTTLTVYIPVDHINVIVNLTYEPCLVITDILT